MGSGLIAAPAGAVGSTAAMAASEPKRIVRRRRMVRICPRYPIRPGCPGLGSCGPTELASRAVDGARAGPDDGRMADPDRIAVLVADDHPVVLRGLQALIEEA